MITTRKFFVGMYTESRTMWDDVWLHEKQHEAHAKLLRGRQSKLNTAAIGVSVVAALGLTRVKSWGSFGVAMSAAAVGWFAVVGLSAHLELKAIAHSTAADRFCRLRTSFADILTPEFFKQGFDSINARLNSLNDQGTDAELASPPLMYGELFLDEEIHGQPPARRKEWTNADYQRIWYGEYTKRIKDDANTHFETLNSSR